MDQPIRTWISGSETDCISASDRGLQYGDGVFETLAVVEGQPLLWLRHMARLRAGCLALGFDRQPDMEALEKAAEGMCRGVARGVLKCVVTRGTGMRGYRAVNLRPTQVLTLWPWPNFSVDNATEGISLALCRTRLSRNPALAGVKHLNRLEQILARQEWDDEFAEGIMLDETGCVIEGTMSNIFAVIGGQLLTPVLSHSGVRGITRECVLECAAASAIDASEARLSVEVLMQAEEIFVTNSLIGLWPVKRFNGRDYKIGKIGQTLQAGLRARSYAP